MENKSIVEIRLASRLRNVDGYEYASRQQTKSLLISPSASPKLQNKSFPETKKKSTPQSATPDPLPINVDWLKKIEILKILTMNVMNSIRQQIVMKNERRIIRVITQKLISSNP